MIMDNIYPSSHYAIQPLVVNSLIVQLYKSLAIFSSLASGLHRVMVKPYNLASIKATESNNSSQKVYRNPVLSSNLNNQVGTTGGLILHVNSPPFSAGSSMSEIGANIPVSTENANEYITLRIIPSGTMLVLTQPGQNDTA